MADRMADLLKRQFEKQAGTNSASKRQEDALEQLLAEQRLANEHLQRQLTAQEQQTQELRDWRAVTQRGFAQTFLRKMALEVPPVVLAVLLAFGINSWWQNSKQERLTRVARENIIQEIQTNTALLEKNIRDNERRIPEIEGSVQQLLKDPGDTSAIAVQGMQMYALTEAAWESAGLSGSLSSLDQDFMMSASKLYQVQLSRSNQIAASLVAMRDVENQKSENLLASLRQNKLVLDNMVHNDGYLLYLYTEFLDEYGEGAAQ